MNFDNASPPISPRGAGGDIMKANFDDTTPPISPRGAGGGGGVDAASFASPPSPRGALIAPGGVEVYVQATDATAAENVAKTNSWTYTIRHGASLIGHANVSVLFVDGSSAPSLVVGDAIAAAGVNAIQLIHLGQTRQR